MLCRVEVFGDKRRHFAKLPRSRIYGSAKRTVSVLVIVANVQHEYFGVRNDAIPVARSNVRSLALRNIDTFSQCDYLGFDLDVDLSKRRFLRIRRPINDLGLQNVVEPDDECSDLFRQTANS